MGNHHPLKKTSYLVYWHWTFLISMKFPCFSRLSAQNTTHVFWQTQVWPIKFYYQYQPIQITSITPSPFLPPPCFVSKIKSRGQILSKRLTAGLRTLAFERFGSAKLMPLMPKNTALEGIVTFTRFPYISGARIRQKIKKWPTCLQIDLSEKFPIFSVAWLVGVPKFMVIFVGPGDFFGINLWIPKKPFPKIQYQFLYLLVKWLGSQAGKL